MLSKKRKWENHSSFMMFLVLLPADMGDCDLGFVCFGGSYSYTDKSVEEASFNLSLLLKKVPSWVKYLASIWVADMMGAVWNWKMSSFAKHYLCLKGAIYTCLRIPIIMYLKHNIYFVPPSPATIHPFIPWSRVPLLRYHDNTLDHTSCTDANACHGNQHIEATDVVH